MKLIVEALDLWLRCDRICHGTFMALPLYSGHPLLSTMVAPHPGPFCGTSRRGQKAAPGSCSGDGDGIRAEPQSSIQPRLSPPQQSSKPRCSLIAH